jgi:hypothetical protein
MFSLAQPGWLLLAVPVVFLALRYPVLGLRQPLRAVLAGVFVVALCQPQVRWRADGVDLWVLADVSASCGGQVSQGLTEWLGILESSRGQQDVLRLVEFADGVQLADIVNKSEFGASRARTMMADAINFVLSTRDTRRASRILLLSDGLSTQPLGGLEAALQAADVPLDYRLVNVAGEGDVQVDGVVAPQSVAQGEPFVLDVRMSGRSQQPVRLELREGGRFLTSADVDLRAGRAAARFTHRMTGAGAAKITATLTAVNDPRPENNSAHVWVESVAPPRVVLVSDFVEDPLRAVLERENVPVQQVEAAVADIGVLAGASCVILNNVPASAVRAEFLHALDFYVRSQGGGLLMAGGRQSFGSGGYFESPIDELLPVSMELREEHRKLTIALAIVMDRSGSMAMTVGGQTKMQLANEGAARSIELLGERDQVCVLAVDTQSHIIVPLVQAGPSRKEAIARARSVASMGGGIYVYTGLKDAWSLLEKSQAGTRHIILFSDAADSEEPGDYVSLIEKIRRQNGTISVIGLGTRADPDAAFIEDVARRGGGRIFFNDNAADLPALFAQETVSVARSTFITETTGTEATGQWADVSPQKLDFLRAVNGYNLCYLRPEARMSLASRDEYSAPLVAHWRRGIGRVAAVTFPLAGEHSNLARNWAGYPDLVLALVRWLSGERRPPGLAMRTFLDGGMLEVEFFYDEGWADRIAAAMPELVLASGTNSKGERAQWDEMRPGYFRGRVELESGEVIRGAVVVGDTSLAFGPVSTAESSEWRYEPARVANLRALSASSGGTERVDLSTVWKAPRKSGWVDLTALFALLGFVVVLADAFRTRWMG